MYRTGAMAFWLGAVGCSLLPLGARAASGPVELSIEGDWVRTDSNGSGDFGSLTSGYEPAHLLPSAAAQLAQFRAQQAPNLKPLQGGPHQVGQAYIVVQQPCRQQNDPANEGDLGINPDSTAIHIVISRDEVVIAPERDGVRIIHLAQGRQHPPSALLMPTAGGNSVGHFEGKDLLVDTVGMSTGPVVAGGWRTPKTDMREHYSVSPDGQHLSIRYIWTDAAIYSKPHTYAYTFDRLPPDSYAFEYWCDPRDSTQYSSIVPPAQH